MDFKVRSIVLLKIYLPLSKGNQIKVKVIVSLFSLSKFISEPNFVSSYDIGNFFYFFFRENAMEYDCGQIVYSRAARVCKNDIGGRFLLEDTWTTFMKARLNCSRPGEIPFYYNELQSTFYLPELDLVYGIFTTNVYVVYAVLLFVGYSA